MKKISHIIAALIITALIGTLGWTGTAQADVYDSYRQLQARQDKNSDYRIISFNGPSSTAVIAIHGGSIESGTSQMAKEVAKLTGADYYSFEGLKKSNNFVLHITSSNFDEPIGKALVAKSTRTLSIHGCAGSGKFTYVGGRDKKLAAKVKARLQAAGFRVSQAPGRLNGDHPSNIANENAVGKGVQLELSSSLRRTFFKDGQTTSTFDRYAEALAAALK